MQITLLTLNLIKLWYKKILINKSPDSIIVFITEGWLANKYKAADNNTVSI